MNFKTLFRSEDSRYTLKTAFLVTLVPLLMFAFILYSLWIITIMNHSYFMANGFPLREKTHEDFFLYILQGQIDYLPYVGLFFVAVFFLGLFLAHLALRPFSQLARMCDDILTPGGTPVSVSGLGQKKLLMKAGFFLRDYYESRKAKRTCEIPKELLQSSGPALDWVYYFQFFCLIGTLVAITIFALLVFSNLLQESVIQGALANLKIPTGMDTFLSGQAQVMDLMVLVPSLLSIVLYGFLARFLISRIEGVTFAYARDLRDVALGAPEKRIKSRNEDPGKEAMLAVNRVLDRIHPEYADKRADMTPEPFPVLGKAQ